MDVAMVTLMTSDLMLLPKAVHLSRRTVQLIRQNLFVGLFIYNTIGIPIAAGVLFPFYGICSTPCGLRPPWRSARYRWWPTRCGWGAASCKAAANCRQTFPVKKN